jgi:hypothetical protein
VIVLRCNGDITSHFADSSGFAELPFFTGSERISQVREMPEKNASPKLTAKGGQSILADLDEAVKTADSESKRDNRRKTERGYE